MYSNKKTCSTKNLFKFDMILEIIYILKDNRIKQNLQPFTDDEIIQFIKNNNKLINISISELYKEYNEHNEFIVQNFDKLYKLKEDEILFIEFIKELNKL